MMKCKIIILALIPAFLCACHNSNNVAEDFGSYSLAVKKENTPKVKYVPVPMPGQYMSKNEKNPNRLTGEAAIDAANKKAMKHPNSGEYINSIMTFDFMPGALYQIYCAPYNITDIQFQINEHILAVGAGDTVRWEASKASSGIGANKQEHLFVKPHDEDLTNSLVITTDMRTYHLVLHSTSKTYMASVAWRYPDSDGSTLLMTNLGEENDGDDIANIIDVNHLVFNYQVKLIKGAKPDWFPRMVFNDGKKTYIKFSSKIQETPSVLIGTDRSIKQIINYRVQGDYYVIDSVVYYMQLQGGVDGKTVVQVSAKK